MSETATQLHIAITPCESSQITGYGYDADSQTLAIQFPGRGATPGSVYHYANVPAEVFEALHASDSKGKFFGSNIRSVYPYEKQPNSEGIVFGLPQSQEPKYTTSTKDGRLTNRSTGKPIPDDEPVFILRAQDVLALHAMRAYLLIVEDQTHASVVEARIRDFELFAAKHPERVKAPDSFPLPATA